MTAFPGTGRARRAEQDHQTGDLPSESTRGSWYAVSGFIVLWSSDPDVRVWGASSVGYGIRCLGFEM